MKNSLALILLLTGLADASAAPITQTAGASTGGSDWNSADWGTPAAVPTAGNSYITNPSLGGSTDATFGVSTTSYLRIFDATGGNTFAGGSLELVSGERMLDKALTGDGATGNLLLDNGSLFEVAANAAGTTFLSGTISVGTGTGFATIGVNQVGAATLNINSSISGSGQLDLAGYGGNTIATLTLNGNINSFAGTIGTLSNGIYGITTNAVDTTGKLNLTLGTFELTNTLDFGSLSVNGVSFANGTYTAAQIDSLSSSTLVDPASVGTISVGAVPEPNTMALAGVAMIVLVIAARRRSATN